MLIEVLKISQLLDSGSLIWIVRYAGLRRWFCLILDLSQTLQWKPDHVSHMSPLSFEEN